MQPEATTAPAVVAVLVSCDPGPWFEEALASLAAQDYPNLSVLVVDAGSAEDPTARVGAALPSAFVRRLPRRVPYGRAANDALSTVGGASHLLLCHDDVALAPDAVRAMVEEAFRSNAGIVAPKLVQWDRPDRLLAVGAAADRFGVVHPLVERGELDQEQHDGVRDVFVAPSGAVLVRADLFATLGGYGDEVADCGEDLDLSWRAQVAGARVVTAPVARVRHLEATTTGLRQGSGGPAARREQRIRTEAHRIRTVLTCYGLLHLLWMVPLTALHALAEAAGQLAGGRSGDAAGTLRAIGAGVAGPRRLWAARRDAQRQRRLPDRELARLLTRGSARLRGWVRDRADAEVTEPEAAALLLDGDAPAASAPAVAAPPSGPPSGPAPGSRRPLPVAAAALLLLLAIGTRSLLGGAVPAVGDLPAAGAGLGAWWHGWWTTWRPAGLGGTGPGAPGLGLLALLGSVLGGSDGAAAHVAVLAPLVLGPIGAYRLVRAWGSVAARCAALLAYATTALPYDALARGRWDGLVAYAGAPWLLAGTARLSGVVPHPPLRVRAAGWRLVGLGLLAGLVGAVAPAALWALAAAAAGLLAGSLLAGTPAAGVRLAATATGTAVLGAAALLPWSAGVLGDRVATFGPALGAPGRLGLGRLLELHVGPVGGALGWGFIAAATLPLVIGRSWRLAWAARLWGAALASVALAWAGGRGWLPAGDPDVLLAPAAAALAGAAALGAVAFQLDLPGYRFGWRQVASAVAALGALAGAVPAVMAAGGGRWDLPSADLGSVLVLPDNAGGDYRVLWVGDPGALPLPSAQLATGVGYATSWDGMPGAADQWAGPVRGSTPVLARELDLAAAQRTTDLGHLLAPLAVRFIVVPDHLAPAGSGAPAVAVPGGVVAGLARQTDLQALGDDPSVVVYENRAWAPARTQLAGAAAAASRPGGVAGPAGVVQLPLARSRPVLRGAPGTGRGHVAAGVVYVAATPGGWRLDVGGRSAAGHPALGAGEAFDVAAGGAATLRAPASGVDRAGQLAEVALVALALVGVAADRRRRVSGRAPDAEEAPAEWFAPAAPHGGRRRQRPGLPASVGDLAPEEVWVDG